MSAAVMALGLILAGIAPSAETPKSTKDRPTNRLAQESSPYLLQHAHNPVNWYPWCPEAFEKAKKENKLVFLSIGYSSCHWCHVMERESFENAAVAKLMNDWFVCIKVDREERPDIDNIYMTALNVQGIRGGWPMSMFLTADAKPIIGGTYWPPEDKPIEGEEKPAPGFKTVLKVMHDWQVEKPQRVQARAVDVSEKTIEALTKLVPGAPIIKLDRELVQAALDDLKERFDSAYGGFGSPARKFRGPKFPSPPDLELLLQQGDRAKFNESVKMATFTLDKMAQGGIYDQLGGGFHRYSVERTWTVPHFEKMLYDNAQLAEVYAHAYQLRPNPLYRRVLEETLEFVAREMTSPEGGFYSALDADSDGAEGQCYVWTPRQIDAVLGNQADADLVKRIYGVTGQPNFEEKAYILVLPRTLTEAAEELKLTEEQLQARLLPLRRKLLDSRLQRPRPFRDTKILTGWNGQMIAGLAAAGQALHEPKYLATAARAADFVLKNLRTKDGRLRRTYATRAGKGGEARLNAYLDDYAYLTHGLLCLHDSTGDRRWLDEARTLTDTMIQYHADDKEGGFFYTSNDHEKLFARSKDQYDGVQPCGNSAAARNLVRLWNKTGEKRYRDLAEKSFKTFAAPLKINPAALTAMAGALALYLDDSQKQTKEDNPDKEKPEKGGVKKSDSVVKIKASVDPEKPGDDAKQVVTVTITIDKGWHLYANPVGSEDLEASQTKVSVSAKEKPDEVTVAYPEGKEINDATVGKYKVYEEKVTIKATVKCAKGDTGPLEVTVKFQSCNDKTCLLPATKKITVP